MTALWPQVGLSVRVAVFATVAAVLVAVPLAYAMSRRRFVGKSLVEAFILLPLVLPPTVVGYLIIVTLGGRGVLGRWAARWFDYNLLFTVEGAVLAAAVVALPLVYLPARAAFASVDRELEDLAKLLGATRIQLFWHVSLPLAARGLASGSVLAFARALGEFGATVMVLGIGEDRDQTLPIAVYLHATSGRLSDGWPAVVLLVAISLVVVLVYNRSRLSTRD
jgi:molybdate transport system permease protein